MARPRKRHWRMEVVWRDSYVELSSWTPIDRLLRNREHLDVNCSSVGFVLADDKDSVVLAGSIHSANATSVIVIPASAVLSRRRLR